MTKRHSLRMGMPVQLAAIKKDALSVGSSACRFQLAPGGCNACTAWRMAVELQLHRLGQM